MHEFGNQIAPFAPMLRHKGLSAIGVLTMLILSEMTADGISVCKIANIPERAALDGRARYGQLPSRPAL